MTDNKLAVFGSESVTNCHQLKLEAVDGKKYLTDAADPETLLRLIQSVKIIHYCQRDY
jgi:DNA-damage-inducible protein D